MTNEKMYIKDIPEKLGISRTKLYDLFKQVGLQTQKDGRRGYITSQQYQQIQEKLKESDSSGQFSPAEREGSKEAIKILVEQFEKEKAELKEELKQERDEKVKIAYQLGQAQTEHQQTKNKLLLLQEISEKPAEPEKKSWWKIWG